MIKILENPRKLIYVTRCECGCKFTFEKADVTVNARKSVSGSDFWSYLIKCPNCQEIVYMDKLTQYSEPKNEKSYLNGKPPIRKRDYI